MSKNSRKINLPPANAIVLIVDDMQSMRMLTRTTLKSMGFRRIVESSNGEEALKRLRLMNIDLIICDWDMPQMNGLDLLRSLRTDPRLSRIPFIMLTAHAEAHLIHEAIATGVDSYLVKPYQPATLCSRVEALIQPPG